MVCAIAACDSGRFLAAASTSRPSSAGGSGVAAAMTGSESNGPGCEFAVTDRFGSTGAGLGAARRAAITGARLRYSLLGKVTAESAIELAATVVVAFGTATVTSFVTGDASAASTSLPAWMPAQAPSTATTAMTAPPITTGFLRSSLNSSTAS